MCSLCGTLAVKKFDNLMFEHANKRKATTKFTAETTDKEITFLDTRVYKYERFKGILHSYHRISLNRRKLCLQTNLFEKVQSFASQVFRKHTFKIWRNKESDFFYHRGTWTIPCSLTGQTFLIQTWMLTRNSIFTIIKSPNLSTLMVLERSSQRVH